MIGETKSHHPAIKKGSVVVYQIHGKELVSILASFLKRMKGVYGWYVLRKDVEKLGPDYQSPDSDQANPECCAAWPRRFYPLWFDSHQLIRALPPLRLGECLLSLAAVSTSNRS
jgi:hypothetical protein